jgi:hypothetical protein
MSDVIGLNPPKAGNRHSFSGRATVTGMKFGMIAVPDTSDGGHDAVKLSTAAGEEPLAGVITSQGDPNSSDAFAVGDEMSIRDEGEAEVLVLGSTAYDEGDYIIASNTAGVGKKLESETGVIMLLGRCLQKCTTGTNPQRISVHLLLQLVKL